MREMRAANVSDRRNYFSRYAETARHMVYRDLVDNYAKEWRERARAATGFRDKKLYNRMDLAA